MISGAEEDMFGISDKSSFWSLIRTKNEARIVISLNSEHDVATAVLCSLTIQDLSDLPTALRISSSSDF